MAPEDRPTFKELYARISAYIEHEAGYLQLGLNPFAENFAGEGEDGEVEDGENGEVEDRGEYEGEGREGGGSGGDGLGGRAKEKRVLEDTEEECEKKVHMKENKSNPNHLV